MPTTSQVLWLDKIRQAFRDALGLTASEVSSEGWRILEPLAAEREAARFLEGAPRYAIPEPPPRLMTPEEVEEYHRGRKEPRYTGDDLSWAAFG